MNATFRCPRCKEETSAEFEAADAQLACSRCQARLEIPTGAFCDGQLTRCLVCPSTELYLRKDFPQRLGVAIVVAGFVASSIAWGYHRPLLTFGILMATALVDVVLFLVMSEAVVCYRCHAQYRLAGDGSYQPFDLETHERYRQQAIRLARGRSAQQAPPLEPES